MIPRERHLEICRSVVEILRQKLNKEHPEFADEVVVRCPDCQTEIGRAFDEKIAERMVDHELGGCPRRFPRN